MPDKSGEKPSSQIKSKKNKCKHLFQFEQYDTHKERRYGELDGTERECIEIFRVFRCMKCLATKTVRVGGGLNEFPGQVVRLGLIDHPDHPKYSR
ncbi:MAG: hypothetical protein HY434_00255 [Candidatus Liptonbacteria bacterium]|nr:hypothetical protein [Candidatus Liptonbacteria bacterium]